MLTSLYKISTLQSHSVLKRLMATNSNPIVAVVRNIYDLYFTFYLKYIKTILLFRGVSKGELRVLELNIFMVKIGEILGENRRNIR